MCLNVERVNENYKCIVPNKGTIVFHNSLPSDYVWPMYSGDNESLIDENFSVGNLNGNKCYLCSAEIGIALIEYLVDYKLNLEILYELKETLIGGMDYWFCIGCEGEEPEYKYLPEWCKEIVQLFIEHDIVSRYNMCIDGIVNDVFIIWNKDLWDGYEDDIEEIAHKAYKDFDSDSMEYSVNIWESAGNKCINKDKQYIDGYSFSEALEEYYVGPIEEKFIKECDIINNYPNGDWTNFDEFDTVEDGEESYVHISIYYYNELKVTISYLFDKITKHIILNDKGLSQCYTNYFEECILDDYSNCIKKL